MKKATLTLEQNGKQLVFSVAITSDVLTLVSGTLAATVISFYKKTRQYKMNLDGFSFARKFDVKLSIDGVSSDFSQGVGAEEISGENVTLKFGVTLSETRIDNFALLVHDLVTDIITYNDNYRIFDLVDDLGITLPVSVN